MDLDTYMGRYTGPTRLRRLLQVARTNEDLGPQAYRMVEQQIKSEGNVILYKEIFGSSSRSMEQQQTAGSPNEQRQDVHMSSAETSSPDRGKIPSDIVYDSAWVTTQMADNDNDRHVLQGRLSTAQSHLHKEAIRSAYLALAHHDTKKGDLKQALGSLLRATDYCTSRTQTAQISLSILEVCLAVEQYNTVREYVSKVEHTLGSSFASTPTRTGQQGSTPGGALSPSSAASSSLQEVSVKLKMAHGLERLASGDYSTAGSIFVKLITSNGGGSNGNASSMDWPGVASPEDIALYASLLCLATQSRASILELAEHPDALELVPAMKELLFQWSRANYVACMHAFSDSGKDQFVPDGDLYLTGACWKTLSQKIREKCLLEYLKPYQRVKLDSMAKLFPTVDNLEDMLVDLIGRGLIPHAKIDARANVLVKTPPQPVVDLTKMEARVLDDVYSMMVRLACLEHDVTVQDTMRGGRKAASTYDSDDSDDDELAAMDVDASAQNPEDLY